MTMYRPNPWDSEDPAALARAVRNLVILWAAVLFLLWLLR